MNDVVTDSTEVKLGTRKKNLFFVAVATLALATIACMKSDYQIAQEAVDCMIRNDPAVGTGLLFAGGKDVYAKMIEQSMTRQDIVAFRDEQCG